MISQILMGISNLLEDLNIKANIFFNKFFNLFFLATDLKFSNRWSKLLSEAVKIKLKFHNVKCSIDVKIYIWWK